MTPRGRVEADSQMTALTHALNRGCVLLITGRGVDARLYA
jgi:hypothetical protein